MKRSEIAAARLKVALAKRTNEPVPDAIAALAAMPLVAADPPHSTTGSSRRRSKAVASR